MLNSRERVLTALHHERPDRCPLQVSFTPEFAERLREELGQLGGRVHNPHGGGNTYQLERAVGSDLLLTSVGWANSYYATETYNPGAKDYTDEWGVRWQEVEYSTRFGKGTYTEMVAHPLADARAIGTYRAPDPNRTQLYEDAASVVQKFGTDHWIVGVTVTTIFETAWALRGYEQMLIDLAADPDLADCILDIPFHYHLAAARRLVELGVDMIWIGDDVGAQHSMLISPKAWRRFLKPRMANFVAELRKVNPWIYIAYHSDGVITPIIGDLVEIGINVLNPVQPLCMNPLELKQRYGSELSFWGSIDIQETMPFGTPDTVRAEVLQRIRTLGRDGGLIIGPTHHIQLDTPMENFRALVDTVRSADYSELFDD